VRKLWRGDLREALREALAEATVDDRRAIHGKVRGGRLLAADVVQRVLDAA
jgi:malonate decarboxylase gamma subunit